ncbi:MAG: hypothetical protein ACFFCS_08330 [Candidatus Hodarchaeota archaeon]
MAKKDTKKSWLIFPDVHSEENNDEIEEALVAKAHELMGEGDSFKFFFLTGNYLGVKGYAYSTFRHWPGALKPGASKTRRPILDATFSCLSVYLSGLVSYTTDFKYAHDEIKDILDKTGRSDLVEIVEEKLPFATLPPKEMLKEGQTPISPYYLIKNDEDLLLAELYPSVQLTEIIENIRSRYFCFFNSETGYNCFGFFDNLPENARFGFNTTPKVFDQVPDEKNILKFIDKEVETLKDLFQIFITIYNNSYLSQYVIEDYESLLNKVLEFDMETEIK